MAVKILIPAPMRGLTGNQARVAIEDGATVGEVLSALAQQYPGVAPRLFETPTDHLAHVRAGNLAVHEQRIDGRPERPILPRVRL